MIAVILLGLCACLLAWRKIMVQRHDLNDATRTIAWQRDQLQGYQKDYAAEVLRRHAYVCPQCKTLAGPVDPDDTVEEILRGPYASR